MAYADRDRVKAWLDAGHGQKLSTLERIVLITIAEEVNSKTRLAWPGHELMITRWGMGSASVKRAMAKLCRLGMLEVAEHGSFGRRSRYRLGGELIDPQRDHTDTVTQRDQTDPVTPPGDHSVPVTGSLSTSNGILVIPVNQSLLRSSNGVEDDDDDGAAHRAPLGSPGAAPTMAVIKQISAALGYTPDQVQSWIEGKLTGRQPRNVDAYLLQCLNNHAADTAKAAAGRSTKKAARPNRPEPAKAGGKQSKKTAAGKFTCPDCGRDFPTTRSLATHRSHHTTVQCPLCNATVKARDQYEHRRQVHRPAPPPAQAKPSTPKFSVHDWQTEYIAGKTKLGLNDWLLEKSGRTPRPPQPCERCNRPLTGWAAMQTPKICANCRAPWAATLDGPQTKGTQP